MTKSKVLFLAFAILLVACWLTLARGQNPASILVADPCQSSSAITKQSAFANISTATTTAFVAVSGSTSVYVCGIWGSNISSVSPDTIIFEQGTGATCAGSPVSLTGSTQFGINASQFNWGNGGQMMFKTAAGNGLCAVTTVGTTPVLTVNVVYVQQ